METNGFDFFSRGMVSSCILMVLLVEYHTGTLVRIGRWQVPWLFEHWHSWRWHHQLRFAWQSHHHYSIAPIGFGSVAPPMGEEGIENLFAEAGLYTRPHISSKGWITTAHSFNAAWGKKEFLDAMGINMEGGCFQLKSAKLKYPCDTFKWPSATLFFRWENINTVHGHHQRMIFMVIQRQSWRYHIPWRGREMGAEADGCPWLVITGNDKESSIIVRITALGAAREDCSFWGGFIYDGGGVEMAWHGEFL